MAEYITDRLWRRLEPCGVLWLTTDQIAGYVVSAGSMQLKEYLSGYLFTQLKE